MSNEAISGWRVASLHGRSGQLRRGGQVCRRGRSTRHEGQGGRPGAALRSFVLAGVHGASQSIARQANRPRSERPPSPSGGLRMPADWPGITRLVLRRDTANLARDTFGPAEDTHPLVSPGTLGTAPSCLSSWGLAGGEVFRWPL